MTNATENKNERTVEHIQFYLNIYRRQEEAKKGAKKCAK